MGSVFLNDANTARLGGWTTFKASAGLARRQFDWSVNAENLFGRERYIVSTLGSSGSQVFPGTAINVYTTIRFRFQ